MSWTNNNALRCRHSRQWAVTVETQHGRLLGLTPRGWFHIQRLHLNRLQLVEMRRLHHVIQIQREDLARTQEAGVRLQRENNALQSEITRLRTAIAELLRRGGR